VGEVDDVQDAPDEREPKPDQGQDAAREQAVDDVLEEINGWLSAISHQSSATWDCPTGLTTDD
jgi:hypothetical protein